MLLFTVWWTTAYFTPPDALTGPLAQPELPVAQPFEVYIERGRISGCAAAAPATAVQHAAADGAS